MAAPAASPPVPPPVLVPTPAADGGSPQEPLASTPPANAPAPDVRELQDAIQQVFDRWDADRSGLLTLDEFRQGIVNEVQSPQFRDDPTVRLVYEAAIRAGAQRLFA